MIGNHKPIVHPFLIAIFPVLSLLDANLGQVTWAVAIRPTIFLLILTFIVLIVCSLLLSSWERGGIVTSIFLFLFSTYGHVYALTKGTYLFGILLGRHRYLLIIWLCLLAIGVYGSKKVANLAQATRMMNIGALLLCLVPLLSLASRGAVNWAETSRLPSTVTSLSEPLANRTDDLPDVYYIILDQYPGNVVLQEEYGFDNSEFTNSLAEMGFYVADRSMSNYSQTELSLASSLNFHYLSEMGVSEETYGNNRAPLWALIKQNAVRDYLDKLGYETIAYETGFAWSQWEDADFYLGPRRSFTQSLTANGSITGFETLLVHNTALIVLEDLVPFARGSIISGLYGPGRGSYDRTTYVLDSLPHLAEHENPIFVFAHILCPHPPFVYSPKGDFVPPDEEVTGPTLLDDQPTIEDDLGFLRSIEFINTRILAVVEEILSAPGNPVIILQGDHGIPGSTQFNRMSILNAYYLATSDDGLLYKSISPVNTFRLIFNLKFGEDFELLEDRAFFSTYDNPYKYHQVQWANP